MIGRIIKTVANEVLRRRHAETGSGPRRLPPTSIREAANRAIRHVIRSIVRR